MDSLVKKMMSTISIIRQWVTQYTDHLPMRAKWRIRENFPTLIYQRRHIENLNKVTVNKLLCSNYLHGDLILQSSIQINYTAIVKR